MARNKPDDRTELENLQITINTSLPADEANDFKKALWQLGEKIASASGGSFGCASKISKGEKRALDAITHVLKIRHQTQRPEVQDSGLLYPRQGKAAGRTGTLRP